MLTKEEHIKYWVDSADEDLQAIQKMYKSGVYLHTLFFAHLHLEKLCKALWVKNNIDNSPPKIQNLIYRLDKAKIVYSTEQLDFMNVMNSFQLEGRYADYKNNLYKIYKKKNTGEVLKQVKILSKWLQEQLLKN